MTYQKMFFVDFNRCINCQTCEMACNEYYGLTDVHRRRVISFKTDDKSPPLNVSMSCNHCMNPICVTICPENNFQKRRDGIVVHQSHNCRGCMRCISACPFHAPKINPKTNRADKCNFCVERIDEGLMPVCVENCITGALSCIKIKNPKKTVSSDKNLNASILKYTNPSIYIIKGQTGKTFFREG